MRAAHIYGEPEGSELVDGFTNRAATASAARMFGLLLNRPRHTLAVLAACLILALTQLPRLTVDFTPRDLYGRFPEAQRVTKTIHDVFGSRDGIVLIMIEAPDVLALEPLQYIHDLSLYFRRQRYAARVDSITTTRFPRRVRPRDLPASGSDAKTMVRDFMQATLRGEIRIDSVVRGADVDRDEAATLTTALQDAPLVTGKLISSDQRVAAVAVALDPSVDRIREIEATVGEIERAIAAHPPPAGVTLRMAGLPHVHVDFARRIKDDQRRLLPAALAVCAAVLWLTFGSLIGIVLPLAAVLISDALLLGGMATVGEPLNILNNITPMLVIVIGLSDSIHLLERYSSERRENGDTRAAVERALASLTLPCFLTSLTDAIGFLSLSAASTVLLARFGVTAAIGVMIAYVVTVALAPACLMIFAPRLRADRRLAARAATKIAGALIPSTRRARGWFLAATALATAVSLIASSQAHVDNTMLGLFEPGDPIYEATKLAEAKLGGVRPLDVVLESSMPQRFRSPEVIAALDAAQRWSESQPGVLKVSSYSDYLHEVWAVLTENVANRRGRFVSAEQIVAFDGLLQSSDRRTASTYINADGTRARLSLQLIDAGSREVVALSDALKETLRRELAAFGDISFAIGGNAYVNSYGINLLMQDLAGSLGLATLAIAASLLLLYRGLAATLLGVLASALPQGLVAAYMVARGIPFNASTIVIFAISMGLAIDGTIHVFAHMAEEEERGGSLGAMIRRAVASTAPATIMNALTLVLGFAVLTLSRFLPLRQFGELSAVAVIASLIGTFALLPTLLELTSHVPRSSRGQG